MIYHNSWSEQAKNQFEKAVAAHGGWQAWNELASVRIKINKFTGFLQQLKGLGRTYEIPDSVIINPKSRRADFHYADHTDTFHDGRLVYSTRQVTVEDGRSLFTSTTFEQWQPQHALYFFGYATVNYLSYPFILPQFELLNFKTTGSSHCYTIRFPGNFHTHCAIQTFYFDSENKLSRHDYHAPFAGPLVFGAHYTEGYVSHKGLQLAQIRKVRPRIGSLVLPLYGIYAEMEFVP